MCENGERELDAAFAYSGEFLILERGLNALLIRKEYSIARLLGVWKGYLQGVVKVSLYIIDIRMNGGSDLREHGGHSLIGHIHAYHPSTRK